ncbi:MAG: hypothetical protein IK102_05140 [Treponema sp.]|nr:hypothetical protein [Treponema sp.]
MKKKFLLLSLILSINVFNLSAQAIGVYFCNSYPAGNWAEYIKTSIGGGINVEYKLPLNLDKADLNLNLRVESTALISKDTGVIKTSCDSSIMPGIFINIPFSIESLSFSFVMELSYGFVAHLIKSDEVSGIYIDQQLCISPGIRFYTPNYEKIVFELAPFSSFAFEQSGVIMQAGFRTGIIWHFVE